jgi:hypothetical protein
MLACDKSDGKNCKDGLRQSCNGLVTNCDDYALPKPKTKPATKSKAKSKTKKS